MAVHVVVVIVAVVGAVSPSTVHVAVVLVAVIGAVSPSRVQHAGTSPRIRTFMDTFLKVYFLRAGRYTNYKSDGM